MNKALLAASGLLALLAASCGTTTRSVDEGTVEELRVLFEQTRCEFRMDDLTYAISVQFPYLVEDSLPPDEIPAGVPDSLRACPTSLLPYSVHFEADGITVTCPSGHGAVTVDY